MTANLDCFTSEWALRTLRYLSKCLSIILWVLHISLVIFLVADTQLYKRLCPSVRHSIGPSVMVIELKSGKTSVFDTFCVCLSVGGGLGCGWGLDASAHPSATILWPRVTCSSPPYCSLTPLPSFLKLHFPFLLFSFAFLLMMLLFLQINFFPIHNRDTIFSLFYAPVTSVCTASTDFNDLRIHSIYWFLNRKWNRSRLWYGLWIHTTP